MKHQRLRPAAAAFAALLMPLAAHSRQEAAAPSQGVGQARTTASAAGPKWLEQTIDIEISRASVLEAIKAVLAAAKVNVEGVESELELPKDTRVTLIANRVKTRDALAAVARLGGALAYVSDTDGKVTVQLRKRTDAGTLVVPLPPTPGQANAFSGFSPSGIVTNLLVGGTGSLPSPRVSIDRRNAEVRDCLRDILKQAGVDFALEDDVPDEARKSFTFDNVPLNLALSLICQSADLGWRAETSNGKTLVRIGKKYARGLRTTR
jgi:hypothetical protein